MQHKWPFVKYCPSFFFQIDENHTIYKAIVDNDRPNVIIKIITKLVVYNFFENFGNGWNNGFWSIIVRVVPFVFFESRSYSSEFPLSWKNTSVNRLYKYLSERWSAVAFYYGKVPSFTYSSLREYKPAVYFSFRRFFHCLNSLASR